MEPDVTLDQCGFYLSFYDVKSYFTEETDPQPVQLIEWRYSKYDKDTKQDGSKETYWINFFRDISKQSVHTAMYDQTNTLHSEILGCKACVHVTEDLAVVLLTKSPSITQLEHLINFNNLLLKTLDSNSLLSCSTLSNLTQSTNSKDCVQLIINLITLIMETNLESWKSKHITIQNNKTEAETSLDNNSNPKLDLSDNYDVEGNWLIKSSYYYVMTQNVRPEYIFSELFRLVNACEADITSIKRGYAEFMQGTNAIVLPVLDDWDLEASGESNTAMQSMQRRQNLSEHQILEYLVQQAQIVELKLDRLELLALREARNMPEDDNSIREIDKAIKKQRSSLHHLKSSFIIATDDLIDRTSHLADGFFHVEIPTDQETQDLIAKESQQSEKANKLKKPKKRGCCCIC